MRIRSIKPEFWRSEDIKGLSRENRLLFIGLWSYVDDNGVGIDDFRQIAADLFAIEDDPTEVREYVREGLATLSRGLLISRYEVDGKSYLYVNSWLKHQRIDKPNLPRYPTPSTAPTSGDDNPDGLFAGLSRESRESLATGTEEQRNRGTEEQRTKTRSARTKLPNPHFDAFYGAFPRKVARKAAEQAWTKAIAGGASPQQVIEGAARYAAQRAPEDPRYTKYPATWLNQGCWMDEPDPPQRERPHLRAVSGGYQPYQNPADQSVYDEGI